MRSLLIINFFLSLCFASVSFAAVPYGIEIGRYNALIISNQNYKNLSPLKTPHADADALAKLLRSDYGFKVTMLRDVNRAGTLDALDQLVERLTPNDNLLIFYAGHGHLDSATGEGYWLPITANARRRSEWISNSDITDTLRATVAKHVLVISDSCFSGTLSRSVSAGLSVAQNENKRQYFSKLAKRRSRTSLSSGGLEPVDDGGASGHSVFAGALITALRRNNEPILEAENLYNLIKRPVALNSSAVQKPQYSDVRSTGHDEGDFLFVKRNIRKLQSKPSVSNVRGVDSQAAYELSFWESIKDSKDERDFKAYLETYPQGSFVSLARLRVNPSSKILSNQELESISIIEEKPNTVARIAIQETPKVTSTITADKVDNVLLVWATPDTEYSPKFSTVEAYSKAIAKLVIRSMSGDSLLYLSKKNLAREVINEDELHATSKKLCQQHHANGVISIELNLSRDIDELTRTPDDVYFGYYRCDSDKYSLITHNLDFQLDEDFAYSADLIRGLNQFKKEHLSLNK